MNCCDGNCRQGRDCPNRLPLQGESRWAVILGCVLLGLLYALILFLGV
jgi:hypothetical protein